MLRPTQLWLACCLPGTREEGDRTTVEVTVGEAGRLVFDVVERPTGRVVHEPWVRTRSSAMRADRTRGTPPTLAL